MSKSNTGARFEIAIDGTTRTHRDSKERAIETATRHWRPRVNSDRATRQRSKTHHDSKRQRKDPQVTPMVSFER
jgi:hypothetical protein